MSTAAPALLSTIQYHDALAAGTLGLIDVVAAAQRLGAGGVEFRPDYWRHKEDDLAAVRRVSAERGLLAIYATAATLFSADATGEERLRRDLDDAVALGSPLLRVFQGTVPDADADPAWARARGAVAYAAERGIVLALENFARAPGCRVTEIAGVLAAIESPALRTNIDIGNYAHNGEDVPEVVRTLGTRVVMSHLKDAANGAGATYLGGGTLPLPAIFAAFNQLPQPIIHCFEFVGGDDPEGYIIASLAYLREHTTPAPSWRPARC